MIPGLRWVDALVAWAMNFAVPLLAAAIWLVSTGNEEGNASHALYRLMSAALLALWIVQRRKVSLASLIDAFRAPGRAPWIGIAAGAATEAILYGLVVAWNFVSRTPNLVDGSWNPWVTTPSLAGPYGGYFLALVVAAPLVEEFVHRGVAYGGLRTSIGRWPAMLITSSVFALGHQFGLYGTGLVMAWVSGLVLVWLADRWRSLGPPLAAHLTMNLLIYAQGWAAYNMFGIPGSGLA